MPESGAMKMVLPRAFHRIKVAIHYQPKGVVKYKSVIANSGNWWTSCQNSAQNAVNLNNGGFNNNNKTNNNSVLRVYDL